MKLYNPNLQLIGGFTKEDANSHIFNVTPEQFIGNDTSKINQAIDFINSKGYGNVVCNGSYLLDSAIIMKSNVTLINNGLIKLTAAARDNIIRAAIASSTPISNIKIEGNGIFQGGDSTWGGDTPTDVNGQSWRAIGILLANVTNFEINNITLKNTAMWGICLEQSRYGKINNVTILQDNSKLNQDGINVRRGSHNIMVNDLYALTFDDTFAITNLTIRNDVNFLSATIYETGKANFDIYQITVKNINRPEVPSGSIPPYIPPVNYGGVLLLCEDGLKIYNVFIDGILGSAQINLGFTNIDYSVTTDATVNDMYNICISNVATAPLYINRPIKNSSFVNISTMDITNTYNSVAFKVGSLNVMRKYHSGNFEFFASV